jgi:hypothetical protein
LRRIDRTKIIGLDRYNLYWSKMKIDNLKSVEDEHIKLAIMTVNNHYAGFGPGTVNIFRNMLGLPEAKWEEKEEEHAHPSPDSKQRTLTDFIS